MSHVALVRCGSYDRSEVADAFGRCLELLGPGALPAGRKGTLLLKPNFLSGAPRERRVSTDPEVIRAAALAVGRGFDRVVCGDSPGLGSVRRTAATIGLTSAFEGTGAELIEFSSETCLKGRMFKDLSLSTEALSSDFMVNLAKLKTHGQMGLTLAVKNTFGCVVGLNKARWHMKVGEDRGAFAKLLVDISAQFPRTLHVLDGIVAMEGNGPGHGTPREAGVLLMSRDPVALDRVACELVGFDPGEILLFDAARELEHGETDLGKIQLSGDDPGALRVRGFKPAREAGLMNFLPLPTFFYRRLRGLLAHRPVVKARLCLGCGVCGKACPAGAIRIDRGLARIDQGKCIRCFCCQELCPEGAIRVKKPLL